MTNFYQAICEALLKKQEGKENVDIFFKLIQGCRNVGYLKEAERFAEEGLVKYPDNFKLLSEYAWNACKAQDTQEEINRLLYLKEKCNGVLPERIYHRLIKAYLKNNDIENAKLTQKELVLHYPYPNSQIPTLWSPPPLPLIFL